jgi:uncharacterized protein YidB (DUF937 family)
MSLFDNIVNTASSLINQGGESSNGNLLDAATQLIRNHPDGLSGVVDQLKSSGLADAVNSWVSTGANQAVSAESIQKALGDRKIGEIASKLGISNEQVSSGLATVLPELINHLTPNGSVEGNSSDLMESGLALLKNKLFGS